MLKHALYISQSMERKRDGIFRETTMDYGLRKWIRESVEKWEWRAWFDPEINAD